MLTTNPCAEAAERVAIGRLQFYAYGATKQQCARACAAAEAVLAEAGVAGCDALYGALCLKADPRARDQEDMRRLAEVWRQAESAAIEALATSLARSTGAVDQRLWLQASD